MAQDRSQQSSEQQRGNQSITRREEGRSSLSQPSLGGWGGGLLSMSPFALLRAMTDEMDRAFSGFGSTSGGGLQQTWVPPMEIKEKDGHLVVFADLPGIQKNDVKVEVNDDVLVIEGERKQEREEGQGRSYRSERSYGRFYRAIQLPDGAKGDQARAEFNNGVLEVKIPVEQSKSNRRQIQIQEGSGHTTGSQTGRQ